MLGIVLEKKGYIQDAFEIVTILDLKDCRVDESIWVVKSA
jgi:hypothetical protein